MSNADYLTGIIEQTVVSLVLIILLRKLNLFNECKFTLKIKEAYLSWPIVVFILLNFADLFTGEIRIDTSRTEVIVGFILVYLSTGFFEEILCRGLVFSLMNTKWGSKGFLAPVLLSSFLFGSIHFIHFFLGDSSLISAISQVVYATFIGVFFAAIVIRNKSIYPAIFLHSVFDIAFDLKEIAVGGGIYKGYVSMSLEQAVTCDVIMLPLFAYGLFILRKELIRK